VKAWEIVGWAYDADIHCLDCARKHFGPQLDDDLVDDSEGNEVSPVFCDAEDVETYHCGDCNEKLIW
jgi:hypothetical protein